MTGGIASVASRRPRWTAAIAALLGSAGLLFLLDVAFPPPLEKARTVTVMVTDRDGRPLRAFPVEDGRWRMPADLAATDPVFIEALLAVEDKRFRTHGGIDAIAVARAAKSALQRGRIVSGASTITMQTARLLEPRPRTFGSKLVEMARAIQLERRLSKDEILELYLTLTPYGGNLEGVRSASWAYFGREPDRLSDDQVALLIALPQAPEARRPDLRPAAAAAGRAEIVSRLADAGVFSAARAREAAEPVLPGRSRFPDAAWHGTARALAHGDAVKGQIASSLDAGLQTALERMLTDAAGNLPVDVQIAAMVVDVETRGVRALVGGIGKDRPGGWIDMTGRLRSPGSTLKPLIYGLAFDDGLAVPETHIQDLPRRFSDYRPRNFDRSFRGSVTVSDALQHSLNVPAVLTLEQIGAERFASALQLAGVRVEVPGASLTETGLAIALGGVGMRMEDLAMVYAGLGDGGIIKPLAFTVEEEVDLAGVPGQRLLSADSSRKLLDILAAAPAPAGRMPWSLTGEAPQIAFKTGTSYGFRDAWAAGTGGGYAVVVWVGRADGAPRPGATGRATALPLLFDVFDRINASLGVDGRAAGRIATRLNDKVSGPALRDFGQGGQPPQILFPPENADLLMKSGDRPDAGFVLAGRGEGPLRWFADGQPVALDAGGAPLWVPQGEGFYTVSAVDGSGRENSVQVRVSGAARPELR